MSTQPYQGLPLSQRPHQTLYDSGLQLLLQRGKADRLQAALAADPSLARTAYEDGQQLLNRGNSFGLYLTNLAVSYDSSLDATHELARCESAERQMLRQETAAALRHYRKHSTLQNLEAVADGYTKLANTYGEHAKALMQRSIGQDAPDFETADTLPDALLAVYSELGLAAQRFERKALRFAANFETSLRSSPVQ